MRKTFLSCFYICWTKNERMPDWLAVLAWIEKIEGSYTGIMGLPLHETAALLEWAGVDVRP